MVFRCRLALGCERDAGRGHGDGAGAGDARFDRAARMGVKHGHGVAARGVGLRLTLRGQFDAGQVEDDRDEIAFFDRRPAF